MRVFVHENFEKNEEISESDIFEIKKRDKDNIYVFNKIGSGYLYIILAIEVDYGDKFGNDISIYSLENEFVQFSNIYKDESIECSSSQKELKIKEKLLLINSIYEKHSISDILLNKYIIIIPGGGIVIKINYFNNLKIYYKKQKI